MTFKSRVFARGTSRKRTGVMNRLEAAYALHLTMLKNQGDVIWFEYEPMKLRLADNTYLTPDFLVLTNDGELQIHETKGSKAIYMDDARVKMKVAADKFPFRFFVIYRTKEGWTKDEV